MNDVWTKECEFNCKKLFKNSEDIACCDGIVTILCRSKDENPKYSLYVEYLSGEYDEPLTLNDIVNKYPEVYMVIFESGLYGKIYNYGNHEEGIWELRGRTDGYA